MQLNALLYFHFLKPWLYFQVFTEGTTGLSPEHKWSITLEDLQVEDSGKYMCKVFNRHGSINYTYTLEVKSTFPGNKPVCIVSLF